MNYCVEPTQKKLNDLTPKDGKSYVKGVVHPPLVNTIISKLLRDTAKNYGDREALIFPNHRLTYLDFDNKVDALAKGFLTLGLKKGDRLGIWAPNRLEWVLTQFATARIGVVLVNINPAYRLSELEYSLASVGCSALVLAQSSKNSNFLNMIRELVPEIDTCSKNKLCPAKLPELRHVIVMNNVENFDGLWSFEDIVELGEHASEQELCESENNLQPKDAINIQFTSGTTGQPKGATLSHYNIVNNARLVTERIRLTENDRLAIPVPLYHCFGMVMGVLGAVSKGAAMVFPGEVFDAKETLDVVANEKCTALYGVPTMFIAMLQELDLKARDLSKMRTGVMAGTTCPVEVMKKVNEQMNMNEVTICYGMTETAPVSFQSFVDDPVEKRCETVGRVHPHLEVKIIDNKGQIVPVGKQGELCTKGYSVMKGYWNDIKRTKASIIDGWMHTGDLAVFDKEGFCTITGRVKDMIIRGGENIYPREIEEFLFSHPEVLDVQVFGIPNDRLGEEVCAWIIPVPNSNLTEDALNTFCVGKISHFKIPKYFRMVKTIPMTITGKPQKYLMRDEMVKYLST